MPDTQTEEFWQKEQLHHDSIMAKLEGLFDGAQMINFKRCGREFIFRHCRGCHATERKVYRCSLKWCPNCNWRITEQRKRILEAWAKQIAQPKHVVLTQRNFKLLTRREVRRFTANISRLRRQKVFRQVKGGSYSIEITNEQRGWHLHAHLLVDARWVDAATLAVTWGKLIGQNFGIVKVKDCRHREYVAEVAKYVAKGSDIARWPAHEINEFVRAVRGVRCFGVFGRLFKLRRQIAASLLSHDRVCVCGDCGASDFYWLDELSEVARECDRDKRHKR